MVPEQLSVAVGSTIRIVASVDPEGTFSVISVGQIIVGSSSSVTVMV